MAEYIDVREAREYVEANYQGDPLLRHLYGMLLEKLPKVGAVEAQQKRIAELEAEAQAREDTVVHLRNNWQASESLICTTCTHCECEIHDGLLIRQTDCGEICGYPCCGKYVPRLRWIPVTERLPEVASTHKHRRYTSRKSIRVLCICVQNSGKRMVKEGYCEWYQDYPEPRWHVPGTIDSVTHWMPHPEFPKEVE